ncbi:MAG: phosphotransferase [Woeseiaceae bacterium]|nr:phosphotransferase [Woeseiaceae bacterium]
MNDRVREWLRRNPEWANARPDELGGGRSHRAWRLTTPHRCAVLKLDAVPRDWPGNSRGREAAVQGRAEEAGLAAPVHWHSTEGILTGWLDGPVLGAAELRDERVLREVGTALRELHAMPPAGRDFDLEVWAAHYRDVLTASGRLDRATRGACDLLDSVSLPGPYVLSHNDLVPANIVAGGGIRFLDWEYAADNSWLFDLATLHVEAALDADATAALFDAYSGNASVPAAFADAVAVYRQLVRLWEACALPAVS